MSFLGTRSFRYCQTDMFSIRSIDLIQFPATRVDVAQGMKVCQENWFVTQIEKAEHVSYSCVRVLFLKITACPKFSVYPPVVGGARQESSNMVTSHLWRKVYYRH